MWRRSSEAAFLFQEGDDAELLVGLVGCLDVPERRLNAPTDHQARPGYGVGVGCYSILPRLQQTLAFSLLLVLITSSFSSDLDDLVLLISQEVSQSI